MSDSYFFNFLQTFEKSILSHHITCLYYHIVLLIIQILNSDKIQKSNIFKLILIYIYIK
jgi:hypothetical protein